MGASVLVAAVLFALGWFAATRFQSPAQRAARAQPPAPTALFATVRQGRLANDVSGSGAVEYARQFALSADGTAAVAVVTRSRSAGAVVDDGSEVAQVSGQPVFAFSGRFDFYRDLTRGETGPDVTQLQKGLVDAGLPVPKSEFGTYGPGTSRAVQDLFVRNGYPRQSTMPLDDLTVAPTLPARVVSATAVGRHLETGSALATLGTGSLAAKVDVDVASAAQITAGMPATLTSPHESVAARVTAIDDFANTTQGAVVSLSTAAGAHLGAVGQTVVATIHVTIIASDALLVPARAISTDLAGTSHVLVRSPHGGKRVVAVRVLGSLAGVSAIASMDGAALSRGDAVEVG